MVILPDSMRDMSRISLIMLKRCWADTPIFSRCSLVFCGISGSLKAILSRPMMAFIGVRISWLILERKEVLALLASSAAASASPSARFWARLFLVSISTSEKHMLTAWTRWSSRSSG